MSIESPVFGPVPSRRLGYSLGVNNIPYKYCSYSCVYCQLGNTIRLTIDRRAFIDPNLLVKYVIKAVSEVEKVDYITFVPDGEPTLDINLGKEIRMIKKAVPDKPVAVLTNASLLWRDDVKADLQEADLVSLKMDAGLEPVWRKINRPYRSLDFNKVVDGVLTFAKEYRGTIITETMLVKGLNTFRENIEEVAKLIEKVNPRKAYLAVPIRPPAEPWVKIPEPRELVEAYTLLSGRLGEDRVELLNMPEPPKFQIRGDLVTYIASLIRVHPIRLDYAVRLAEKHGLNPDDVIEKLLSMEGVEAVEYGNTKYLVYRPKTSTGGS